MKNSKLFFPIFISFIYVVIAAIPWFNAFDLQVALPLTIISCCAIILAWISFLIDSKNKNDR